MSDAWTATADGIRIAVRASPRGGRDAIEGLVIGDDGRSRLAVRLAAAPTDGVANDAVVRLIAKALAVARRDVVLESGATSRLKRLHISGDPARLGAALDHILRERA